ncbi:MAG: efflux RND transporter periplasmic adaptor subunit [Bacteroidales bacterium]|nr:efflux RND transporter periplasmic adaptor subunit [Bacteroidales bacterium]
MKKSFVYLLAVPALLSVASCSNDTTTEVVKDNRALVRVDTIRTTVVDRKIEYTANLEANEQVFYAPTLAGTRIRKIYVEVGDKVSKGQTLVEMDNNTLQQQELQLKNVETEYNRAVKLMETGSISQQNYDAAVTQYEVMKKAIATLKENTRMVAPFNGVVTGKFMEEGELWSGGAFGGASKPAIIAVEQINPIKAIVNIAEQYYLEISKGMKVSLQTEVYGKREFEGKVNIVYPSINPQTRTFSVELLFDNAKQELRPGMYGTVAFSTGKARTKVVQSIAVLKVQGSNDRFIFLARDGKAKRVSVKITNRYDDKVEIEPLDATINDGDLIVTTGQAKLVDGKELNIKID